MSRKAEVASANLFVSLTDGEGGHEPLAFRMRPRRLDEVEGQEHILGPGRLLRRAIESDQLSSLIFYGPPGTGKTTLAMVIARQTSSHFITINAVLGGVADIRNAVSEAERRRSMLKQKSILFVDEVHRFNKAQQDALLPHVESGTLILIGATTENPYFEVNKALVSRSRVFQLHSLSEEALGRLLDSCLTDPRGYGKNKVRVESEAKAHILKVCRGDARSLMNALELAVEPSLRRGEECVVIDLKTAEDSAQERAVLYDRDGDAHYDTISAFIKSIRGSDPDAALYWMAQMVKAGEDPRFIFRRMLISASEDVGLADPQALVQVTSAFRAFEVVGMPEGQFHLAQACLYLCNAPKSNTTLSFFAALKSLEEEKGGDVPDHLKDASRDGADLGHGKGYRYPHAFHDHWVAQQYLPESLRGRIFYRPSDSGQEKGVAEDLDRRREASLEAMLAGDGHGRRDGLKTKERWINRSLENSDRMHTWMRNQVMEMLDVERADLCMDIHAGHGLMTWELLRRAAEGGVISGVKDETQLKILQDMCEGVPALDRPRLLLMKTGWTQTLKEEGIAVDKVVLRRWLESVPLADLRTELENAAALMKNKARLVSVDLLAGMEPRLSVLMLQLGVNPQNVEEFARCEDFYYQERCHPRLLFDEAALRSACPDSLRINQVERGEFTLKRRLCQEDSIRWLGEQSQLAQLLDKQMGAGCAQSWLEILKPLCRGQSVAWKRNFLFTSFHKHEGV